MKCTIGLALIGALAFSTSSWAQSAPRGSGISLEHSFDNNTTVVSTNLNGAVNFGSGNSANLNSNKSSSNSCAGICANGNKLTIHHSSGLE
jgi:hypothetical protein